MRLIATLAAVLILGGCAHGTGGNVEAAGISAGASLVGIANQDLLDFLRFGRKPETVATPASGSTPAGAQ